jgi:hypothetical protein
MLTAGKPYRQCTGTNGIREEIKRSCLSACSGLNLQFPPACARRHRTLMRGRAEGTLFIQVKKRMGRRISNQTSEPPAGPDVQSWRSRWKRRPSGPARRWPGPGPHPTATDVQEGAGKEQCEAAGWPSLRLMRSLTLKISSSLAQDGPPIFSDTVWHRGDTGRHPDCSRASHGAEQPCRMRAKGVGGKTSL